MLLFRSYLTADLCRVPAHQPPAVLWLRTFAEHFTFSELLCFRGVCVVDLRTSRECDAASLCPGPLVVQLCREPSLVVEVLAVLGAVLVCSTVLQRWGWRKKVELSSVEVK